MGLRRVPLRTVAPVTLLATTWLALWLGLSSRWGPMAVTLCVVMIVLTTTVLIYRERSSLPLTSTLLCLGNTAASALALWTIGPNALAWAYLTLMSNFFIADRRTASLCNLALLAAMTLAPGVLLGPPVNHSGVAVALLILIFGYRFSSRLQGNHARLEALATRDVLTGLPNRRALERALTRLIGNGDDTTRFQHALLVLDLDHFKEVNDRHGHKAGDAALMDLSMILRIELRELDQVFRFGGEEFVILARIHSRSQLEGVAERIRAAVQQSLKSPDRAITVSIGAAMYAGEQQWMDWFARADAALYRSKESGRNSFSISDG